MDFSWFVYFRNNLCLLNIILGDRNHLNDAKKNAQDFYKDLTVTIEDIHH
jgi:hypothetical protein